MYRSCLRGGSAIPPRAKKAYHFNTMPCLPIRHASTLTYGLYYRYQRANKAHEWKMSVEMWGVFQYYRSLPRHCCRYDTQARMLQRYSETGISAKVASAPVYCFCLLPYILYEYINVASLINLLFRHFRKENSNCHSPLVRPTVFPHGTWRLPPKVYYWNFMFGIFTKMTYSYFGKYRSK